MWARWRRRPSRPQAALQTLSRRSCGRLLLDLRPKGMTNGAAGRPGLRRPRAAAMQTGSSHSRRRSSESLWSRGDGGPAVSTTSCHRPPADRESGNIGRIGRCRADSQGLSCTHKIAHRIDSSFQVAINPRADLVSYFVTRSLALANSCRLQSALRSRRLRGTAARVGVPSAEIAAVSKPPQIGSGVQ